MDWAKHLEVFNTKGGSLPTKSYNAASRAIESLGNFRQGGYWTDTKQRCVSFGVYEDGSNVAEVVSGIETLVPFMRDGESGKRFHINEYTCGDSGVYSLVLRDGKWIVTIMVYGSERIIREPETLMASIEYIRTYHPCTDYRSEGGSK